jgi:general secretion pathway protein K
MVGVKPIKFQSESDFGKSIATESKVFSVYSVGVVKGYKRETRVKIHTVVDFRSSPSLANLSSAAPAGSSTPPAAAPSASGQGANAIASALAPSIGGQVIYFNIE